MSSCTQVCTFDFLPTPKYVLPSCSTLALILFGLILGNTPSANKLNLEKLSRAFTSKKPGPTLLVEMQLPFK